MTKDDNGGPKDGGRHDVTRDGQTGKTGQDIDPGEYDPGKDGK